MFTSQAPQLFNALQGAVSGDSARQLTQIFANCNQALTHRGSIDLQNRPMFQKNGVITSLGGDELPPWATGNQAGSGESYPFGGASGSFYGGNYYGVDAPANSLQFAYRPGSSGWLPYVNVNPGNYTGGGPIVLPGPGGGYRGGDWITYLGDTNIFDVAPRVTENINQYYGGPTFQVAGDSYYDNTVTNNSYVTNLITQNITVEEINGNPVKGDGGDPGFAGPAGPPGFPGNPGAAGPGGADGVAGGAGGQGIPGPAGMPGRNGRDGTTRIINVGGGGGGGGGGGRGPIGPPGPPGEPADLDTLRKYVQLLGQNLKALIMDLKNLELKADLTDDCRIRLWMRFNPKNYIKIAPDNR